MRSHFLVFLICAAFLTVSTVVADSREVNGDFDFVHDIQGPSIFSISNFVGSITVKPYDGQGIRVKGSYKARKPGRLVLSEVEPGKVKISLNSHIRSKNLLGGLVSFGGSLFSGFHISIGKSSLSISFGGKEQGHLEVLIPQHLLQHLKVRSELGDISVGDFSEEGENLPPRFVYLKSESGNIKLAHLKAPGGITAKLCMGEFCATKIQGDLEIASEHGGISVDESNGYVFANGNGGCPSMECDRAAGVENI